MACCSQNEVWVDLCTVLCYENASVSHMLLHVMMRKEESLGERMLDAHASWEKGRWTSNISVLQWPIHRCLMSCVHFERLWSKARRTRTYLIW
jgi:hypothetical protein